VGDRQSKGRPGSTRLAKQSGTSADLEIDIAKKVCRHFTERDTSEDVRERSPVVDDSFAVARH
jgi:hypothetical protein